MVANRSASFLATGDTIKQVEAALEEMRTSFAAQKAKWEAEKMQLEETDRGLDEGLATQGRSYEWKAGPVQLSAAWADFLSSQREHEQVLLDSLGGLKGKHDEQAMRQAKLSEDYKFILEVCVPGKYSQAGKQLAASFVPRFFTRYGCSPRLRLLVYPCLPSAC